MYRPNQTLSFETVYLDSPRLRQFALSMVYEHLLPLVKFCLSSTGFVGSHKMMILCWASCLSLRPCASNKQQVQQSDPKMDHTKLQTSNESFIKLGSSMNYETWSDGNKFRTAIERLKSI